MRFTTAVPAILALVGATTAAPLTARDDKVTADIIARIAPLSQSCSDTNECRTNVQAAPFISAATANLSTGATAAVIALTAFESADYKYKRNKYPGRPGQGTSNMQMVNYNILYAQSIPALQSAVAQIGSITTDDQRNELLDLLVDDKYNFGSGPWFLTTQCSPEVLTELDQGTDAAFSAYMACVGTDVTSDRLAYWTRAKAAFNL
ncbi:hypothetical protein GGR50DRAFT_387180 [Xylaria sp. CBS 124048]|nr:hypothetical protein GGR50DRAFT_387180 [Xylaria sp. CBS 124048]